MEFCRVHFNFELRSHMLIRRYKQFLDNATAKTDLVKYFYVTIIWCANSVFCCFLVLSCHQFTIYGELSFSFTLNAPFQYTRRVFHTNVFGLTTWKTLMFVLSRYMCRRFATNHRRKVSKQSLHLCFNTQLLDCPK